MKKILSIYKPIGKTPLEVINELKKQHPEYKNESIGYAGRLDPMAEGILLLLIGEENLKRKEYEKFPKEYEFEVLFGIETDTYDTLGIIKNSNTVLLDIKELEKKVQQLIPRFIGKKTQPYPPYSSPRVNGKPLFYWAREGKLDEITIPKKQIEIYTLELIETRAITASTLEQEVSRRVSLVTGDFRQEKIIEKWQEEINKLPNNVMFPIITLRISCSSGTYIRSICHELGILLHCSALAFNIKRTRVGEFT